MEGNAAGKAPQSKKKRRCCGRSTSVSKEEGDAAGEAPQSKKKRVMLSAKHLSKKWRVMLRVKHLSLKRRG